jgi:predicted nucleic acid-binding Zn ribbon protein
VCFVLYIFDKSLNILLRIAIGMLPSLFLGLFLSFPLVKIMYYIALFLSPSKYREEKREQARQVKEEKREQARQVKEARAKRSEVEKDGIFYCQFCGKREARLGSGMVADDVAYCSQACGDLLARQMFNRDVTIGGGQVVNVGGGALGRALGSLGTGIFEIKHCKWCGYRLALDDSACSMCEGVQEKRRQK